MTLLGFLLLAPSSLWPQTPPAEAPQERVRETVVSANKLEEPLARAPLSATVVEQEELEQAGLLTVRDAAARVPNLYLSEFSSRRLSFPFVRGVGSGINDAGVITYVDDVPQFGFGGTNLPLLRVERLEFLRGPQGTLYGKNALGGLIHVHGRRPTLEREIEAGASFGSYDLTEFTAGYSGPVGSGLLGDVGLMKSDRDGFTKNDFTGNRVDERDGSFGRGRVLWNPSADSELDFSLFGEHARDGGFVLSELDGLRANPHHINQDFEGVAERDVYSPALVWRVLGEELDFTSVSAYQDWDVLETSDFDFSPFPVVVRTSEEDQSYVYQEFRVGTPEMDVASDRRGLRWLVGASGFFSDSEREATNAFGVAFPVPNSTDFRSGAFDDYGLALFGQATVQVNATWDLTAGLRLDHESKEADLQHTSDVGPPVSEQNELDEDFDEFVPMFGASAHLAESALLYARAARGFKAGGFNLGAPTTNQLTFDSETSWTYELGYRQAFDQERYHLSAAAFFVDWQDMQLSLFDPAAGGFVDNAGESNSKGVELEGQARLGRGWDGFLSLGLLDTEIEEGIDPAVENPDPSGNDLPQSPETTLGLGLQYGGEFGREARWFVRGDYQGVGDFSYDSSNLRGESFALTSFRAGISGRHLGLTAWVSNAFDEEYVPLAFRVDDPSNPGDGVVYVGESGAPRVLGFTLSVHL